MDGRDRRQVYAVCANHLLWRLRATLPDVATQKCCGRARLSALRPRLSPRLSPLGSAPGPRFMEPERASPFDPRAASSSRAGRNASRAGSQDRPGAGLRAPRAGAAPAPSLGRHRSTSLRMSEMAARNTIKDERQAQRYRCGDIFAQTVYRLVRPTVQSRRVRQVRFARKLTSQRTSGFGSDVP